MKNIVATPPDVARLARRLRGATVAAGILAVVALLWLAALTEPGNVAGVVILEVITVVPLALVVRYRRGVAARIRALPTHEPTAPAAGGEPAPLPPWPPLRFDPSRQPDLVLHPRRGLVVTGLVLSAAFIALMLKLSYDSATFDPRIALLPLYAVGLGVAGFRGRIVVSGGVLWRRRFGSPAGVDLRELQVIRIGRARFFRREGFIRTILRVEDRHGRAVSMKPVLWAGGSSVLLAGLAGAARAQGVTLDDRTRKAVERASARAGDAPMAWAYRLGPASAAAGGADPEREPPAPARSTLWTRRDEHGVARKVQLQRLVPMLLVAVLMIPATIVVGNAGTRKVRSLRCRNDRRLWIAPVADPPVAGGAGQIAVGLVWSHAWPGHGVPYVLRPDDLANRHNTATVQRDAERLTDGGLAQWSDGGRVRAEVFIERFSTPVDAVTFHRDYAEDHCHGGDVAFAVPQIPGAVGFRCGCVHRDVVNDRVSYVRGAVRVQALVYGLRSRDGHGAAIALAQVALDHATGRPPGTA